MFKRINKRIRKTEEAEVDDEVLDNNDTDSDESESESEASDDLELGKRRRDESEDEGEDEGEDEKGSEESEEEDDPAPMTVAEALVDPLYPTRGEAKACILCPGKELKHDKMVSVHIASSTHLRRAKRFATLAARVGDEDEDPRLLVAALDESVRIAPKAPTKRPPKKDRRMAKRQRRKERRSAKTSSDPVKKT